MAEENDAAHKTVNERIEKMSHDFEDYHKRRHDERNKVVVDA